MTQTAQFLSVFGFQPRVGWDQGVAVRPEITVRFNQALDLSLVETGAALNAQITLLRTESDTAYDVEFVSWNADTRILKFRPVTDLAAGGLYQVTLRETLRGSSGRGLVQPVSWYFEVGAGQLTLPVLLAPGDATAWSELPTLQWVGASGSAATGLIAYDVQLADDWSFSDLAWSTTVTVSGAGGSPSAAIGAELPGSATYFWRVRATTAALTGDWTDAWAFWVGTTAHASPETEQLYHPDLAFTLAELLPEDGASHLSEWPTVRATFTQAVSGASVGVETFQLWAAPVDGRADTGASRIGGEYLTVGSQVNLTPSGSIAANTRYTLRLTPALISSQGEAFPETVEAYFTGPYTPCYGGTIAVRGALDELLADISDDQILFHLWRASLDLHALLAGRTLAGRQRLTFVQLVTYHPAIGVTWEMFRYAELSAAISLLQNEYSSLLRIAGRRSALATFEREVRVELLPELRAQIKDLKAERDGLAATFFNDDAVPRTGVKSQLHDPCFAVDLDFPPRAGLRPASHPYRPGTRRQF